MFALINYKDSVAGIYAAKFDVSNLFSWVEIPEGAVVKPGYIYQNGSFIDPRYPDLARGQVYQQNFLAETCQNLIYRGFKSSALGESNYYASGETDQRNIVQSAQSTKGGLISLYNLTNNTWSRETHTQTQSQQVLEDFVVFRDGLRTQLSDCETQIMTATTIDEVKAIVWQNESKETSA